VPEAAVDQAAKPAESLVDQLAKSFDQGPEPEPTEPQEATADADAPEEVGDGLEDVEYEGQTYKVPAPLKEAIIQKGDYTSKTQEVANARRNVELLQDAMKAAQAEQAFTGSIAPELNQLAATEARQKDLIARWNTLSIDEKQEVYLLDKQMSSLQQGIDGKRQEFGREQTRIANELKAKAKDVLQKSIPNFNEQLAKDIAEHAISEGYTKQEIDAIWDPRHAKTLYKAMQFDRLQKAAVKAPKPVVVVKPGASNPMPAQVKTDLNMRKAQKSASTSSDKAKVIQARLEASFR
jgi:hypothetical protein